MRRLLLILCLSAFTFTFTSAQVYYPFPDSGAVWTVFGEYQSSPTDYHNWYDEFTLGGDTIIGNYTYRKFTGTEGTNGGLREDTSARRIYFAGNYNFYSLPDTLLYDFNLQVGDTAYYETGNSQWMIITGIDSVLIQGQYHKRFSFNNWSGEEWVEGIGSLSTPVGPLTFEFEWNNTLNCLQDNSGLVYQRGQFPTNCAAWHGWIAPWCGLMSAPETVAQVMNVELISDHDITTVNISGAKGNCSVNVYDISGKVIFAKRQVQYSVELNTADLAGGIYLLRIEDESGNMIARKIIF